MSKVRVWGARHRRKRGAADAGAAARLGERNHRFHRLAQMNTARLTLLRSVVPSSALLYCCSLERCFPARISCCGLRLPESAKKIGNHEDSKARRKAQDGNDISRDGSRCFSFVPSSLRGYSPCFPLWLRLCRAGPICEICGFRASRASCPHPSHFVLFRVFRGSLFRL